MSLFRIKIINSSQNICAYKIQKIIHRLQVTRWTITSFSCCKMLFCFKNYTDKFNIIFVLQNSDLEFQCQSFQLVCVAISASCNQNGKFLMPTFVVRRRSDPFLGVFQENVWSRRQRVANGGWSVILVTLTPGRRAPQRATSFERCQNVCCKIFRSIDLSPITGMITSCPPIVHRAVRRRSDRLRPIT